MPGSPVRDASCLRYRPKKGGPREEPYHQIVGSGGWVRRSEKKRVECALGACSVAS